MFERRFGHPWSCFTRTTIDSLFPYLRFFTPPGLGLFWTQRTRLPTLPGHLPQPKNQTWHHSGHLPLSTLLLFSGIYDADPSFIFVKIDELIGFQCRDNVKNQILFIPCNF